MLPIDQLLVVVENPPHPCLEFDVPGGMLLAAGLLNPPSNLVKCRLGTVYGALDPLKLVGGADEFCLYRLYKEQTLCFVQVIPNDLDCANEDFVFGSDFRNSDSVLSKLEAGVDTGKNGSGTYGFHTLYGLIKNDSEMMTTKAGKVIGWETRMCDDQD
jgi:hypothetical protein